MKYLLVLVCLAGLLRCKSSSQNSGGNPAPSPSAQPGAQSSNAQNSVPGTGAGPTAAFLNASVLQPPANIKQIQQSDLIKAINTESDFMLTKPSNQVTDNCSQQFKNDLRFVASGSGLAASLTQDWTNCLQSGVTTAGETISNVILKFYAYLECPGTDLSRYVGQNLASISNPDSICTGTSSSILFNTSVTGHISVSSGGSTGSVDIVNQSATMASDGGKCTATKSGTIFTISNCNKVNRTDYSNGTGTMVSSTPSEFSLYQMQNLQYVNPTDAYYSSGVMAFAINNWKGQMIYTGATIAPRWTASTSDGLQNASGQFVYQATNLALLDPSLLIPSIRLPKF